MNYSPDFFEKSDLPENKRSREFSLDQRDQIIFQSLAIYNTENWPR